MGQDIALNSEGPHCSVIGSHSPSTKVAHLDLLHVDKTQRTNGLFHQNNNSLFHLKRSGRASPPSEPLLTSNTGNVGKIPCSAHLEVLSGLTCSGAEHEEHKHLPIWQLHSAVGSLCASVELQQYGGQAEASKRLRGV